MTAIVESNLSELTNDGSNTMGPKDEFRIAEKKVKEYINSKIKRKGKRKAGHSTAQMNVRVDDGETFDVDEIVNVHDSVKVLSDSRIREVPTFDISHTLVESGFNVDGNAKAFTLSVGASGFYVIRGALNLESQIHWGNIALAEYSKSVHTNLTNLSGQYATTISAEESAVPQPDCNSHDLWELSSAENNNFAKFKKLRWANLGFHYNWTLRKYVQNEKSVFPEDFGVLCKQASNLVGLDINPEAGIVNYYPSGTQMCGHIDDAEHCMTEPIVSFSIGCSCVFLLGGVSKDIQPIPLLLRSGDCVVMSGESRYCYHGVPVILTKELEAAHFESSTYSGSIFDAAIDLSPERPASASVIDYLSSARVNINARRVTLSEGVWVDKNGSGYDSNR